MRISDRSSDVCSSDLLELVATVSEAFGGIDMLVVSTAANVLPRLVGDIAPEDIARILVDQAAAPMVMSRPVLPVMPARGAGSTLVVASDPAHAATPAQTLIASDTAATTMLPDLLAVDGKPA